MDLTQYYGSNYTSYSVRQENLLSPTKLNWKLLNIGNYFNSLGTSTIQLFLLPLQTKKR